MNILFLKANSKLDLPVSDNKKKREHVYRHAEVQVHVCSARNGPEGHKQRGQNRSYDTFL